mgnify:CR=1 FL=1
MPDLVVQEKCKAKKEMKLDLRFVITMLLYKLQVGELHFKNSYTAYLTLKAKCRIPDSKDGKRVIYFNTLALSLLYI